MQSQIAEQILAMAGQGGRTEGSISGDAISAAIASLEKALEQQREIPEEPVDEDKQDPISLGAVRHLCERCYDSPCRAIAM